MRASARFVGPIERLLYLRAMPNMRGVPSDVLVPFAQFLEEREYSKGQVLIRDDGPVDALYFVVEGRIDVSWKGRRVALVEPPFAAGFLGFLSRQPSGTLATARDDCLTLRIDAEVFSELLDDEFSMLDTGLRQTARQFLSARHKLPVSGEDPPMFLEDFGFPETPFDLVERLIWTRETSPVFRDCNLDALAEICRYQTELRVGEGEVLWRAGDPSDWGMSIIFGNVRYTDGDTGVVRRAGAGSSLGYPDCIAAQPRGYDCVTETDCVLLKGARSNLIDVLEDNHQVALQILGSLCSSLLDIYASYGPNSIAPNRTDPRVASDR